MQGITPYVYSLEADKLGETNSDQSVLIHIPGDALLASALIHIGRKKRLQV